MEKLKEKKFNFYKNSKYYNKYCTKKYKLRLKVKKKNQLK